MAKKRDHNKDISFEHQKIVGIDLEKRMKQAYIDYAMSVIVSRALPDVRDGLKPVHRRILYTMYEDNLTPDRAYRKSATTVGDVLGRYHPHGDSSVYDAMVRLAQDFSMRYPLVDGHGNFGSVDGDPPAAYRYTEARMSRISQELLTDIEKDTVDFTINFDNTRKEPTVVPSRFPNLLVNGSSGIAVGMATNIPPHNLREVIDALLCVMDYPEADLDDLMEHIKGPDFPTAGLIAGRSGIRAAYGTGRGRIRVRARAEIEEHRGHERIVVSELPYQVNKSRLVSAIGDLIKNKTLEGISDIRDESDREGMHIVIDLKRDANAQVVLNRLYASTQMEDTFSIILLALVDGKPKILTLREILDQYIAFQEEVIVRRTRFDLKKAQARAHLVEGLRIASDHIDEVIRIIRESYDDAKQRLMDRFSLSEVQAQAILDMRLGRLQGLERDKLESEYQELMERIARYQELLSTPALVAQQLKTELTALRDRYGDERRTEIMAVEDDLDIEDLIDQEECVYTLTHMGYLKRQSMNLYRAQRRGGRGISAQTMREEDIVETVFVASTHDYILFFTNQGRVHQMKGYRIPEAGRSARGTNIINLLPLEPEEKVTAMIPTPAFDEGIYLVMITRKGTVKRIALSMLHTARKTGIRALTLEEGDELISVRKTDGQQNLILATRQGRAICFSEEDIRPMGREAAGVRGIRLAPGDEVVGAARTRPGGALLTVTENGYGKRTPIEEYLRGGDNGEPQHRGGKGMLGYRLTEKTGAVAAVKVVDPTDDVFLISDDGTMIRMRAGEINCYSRVAQGVRVMRLAEGVKVISLARTPAEESDDQEESAANPMESADELPAEAPEA